MIQLPVLLGGIYLGVFELWIEFETTDIRFRPLPILITCQVEASGFDLEIFGVCRCRL